MLVTVGLLLLCAVAELNADKCPWFLGKYPFDSDKFSGKWYVIAATPHAPGLKVPRCAHADYSMDKGRISVTYKGIDDGKPVTLENIAEAYFDPDNYSSDAMGVWSYNKGNWSEVAEQAIIATDYDTYALKVTCMQNFNRETKSFEKHMTAAILARTASLREEKVEILKDLLKGVSVGDKDIHNIDHKDCTYE